MVDTWENSRLKVSITCNGQWSKTIVESSYQWEGQPRWVLNSNIFSAHCKFGNISSMGLLRYVRQTVLSPSLDADSTPVPVEISICSLILGSSDLFIFRQFSSVSWPSSVTRDVFLVLGEVTSFLTHCVFSQISCLSTQVPYFVGLNFSLWKHRSYKFIPFLNVLNVFSPSMNVLLAKYRENKGVEDILKKVYMCTHTNQLIFQNHYSSTFTLLI